MDKRKIIEKYFKGESTKEDLENFLALFQDELSQEEDAQFRAYWEEVYQGKMKQDVDISRVSKGLMAKIQENNEEEKDNLRELKVLNQKQNIRSYRQYALGIAASLLLLITLAWALLPLFNQTSTESINWKEINVKPGERQRLTLSDGTKVHLNAGSYFKYPERFSGDTREVIIQGEAYFDVIRDAQHPFVVKTKNTKTTVLGTKFNVNAYPQDSLARVSLVEGSVKVNYLTQQDQKPAEIILKPNEALTYSKKQKILKVVERFDPLTVTGWKENIFVFDKMTLLEISQVLERHFNVKFQFQHENLKHCVTNLKVKSDNIEKILKSFSLLSNIKYEREGSRILLSGGC